MAIIIHTTNHFHCARYSNNKPTKSKASSFLSVDDKLLLLFNSDIIYYFAKLAIPIINDAIEDIPPTIVIVAPTAGFSCHAL